MDWLALCQDNVCECDSRSWCQWPGVPLRQHYQVTMSAYCHKSVLALVLDVKQQHKTTTNNQTNKAQEFKSHLSQTNNYSN